MHINVPSALIAALSDAAGRPAAGSTATGDGNETDGGNGDGSGSKEGEEGLERDREQQRLPLLLHLSTDQVYEGTKSFYKEDDPLLPVNTYGRSKVAGEQAGREQWRGSHAILRSSIIVGPPPPVPLKKTLPLQVRAKGSLFRSALIIVGPPPPVPLKKTLPLQATGQHFSWMDGALHSALASANQSPFFTMSTAAPSTCTTTPAMSEYSCIDTPKVRALLIPSGD
ncbi:unnamed protein product [Closterium sp. Naga37s-1]|nr:unnamed protein product [Closterium sp. Naga37s-1]